MDIKVAPQSLLLQTAEKLREAITQGHFAPGERLVETALCARMGVSRTTIREALRRLESERLVRNAPNRGPSVAAITPDMAEQIYDVRKLLEGEAAALFAARASAEQILSLEAALRAFTTAVSEESSVDRVRATSDFYDVILTECGNTVIFEMLSSLHARINVLRARSMASPGRSKFSLIEMRAILEAIERRDCNAARKAAEAHVAAAREAALAALRATNEREAADQLSAVRTSETANKIDQQLDSPPIIQPHVDDAMWEEIKNLLPQAKVRRFQHPGRKPIADRQALEGILFVLANRIGWNQLPTEFGYGSGISCWRKLRSWQGCGAWDQISEVLRQHPRSHSSRARSASPELP